MLRRLFFSSCVFFSLYLLNSCGAAFNQPVQTQGARLGEVTNVYSELTNLPSPTEPIIATVYKFRDQTGQYKDVQAGSSFSTAVTQGATSILLKAMEDSGWFVSVERENQNDLLTERQLIRSSQQQYLAENPDGQVKVLPSLTYADLILEGGIISHDANLITGGFGLRYFGVGGSTEYREDRVTIYLRAVSTRTGEILKTVYTSKTILSQALDGNIFRYVDFQRLLEAETGFTYNEPSQMAVTAAIEKALASLIIEGIEDGYWKSRTSEEEMNRIIEQYNQEKSLNQNTKLLDRYFDMDRRGYAGLMVSPTFSSIDGDYDNANFEIGGQASAEFFFNRNISIQPSFTFSRISVENVFATNFSKADLVARYVALPYEELSPYVKGGGSLFFPTSAGQDNNLYFGATYDVGVEYLIKNQIGIFGEAGQTLLFSDNIDGISQGRRDDYIWNIDVGLSLYLRRKSESTPVAGVYDTDYLDETESNESTD